MQVRTRHLLCIASVLFFIATIVIWIRSTSHIDAFGAVRSPVVGTRRCISLVIRDGRIVIASYSDAEPLADLKYDFHLPDDDWHFVSRSEQIDKTGLQADLQRFQFMLTAIKQDWRERVYKNDMRRVAKMALEAEGCHVALGGLTPLCRYDPSLKFLKSLGAGGGSMSSTGRPRSGGYWLLFPVWSLVLAWAIATTFSLQSLYRSRRRMNDQLCVGCGYDLRATPDRCPECGAMPEKSTPSISV